MIILHERMGQQLGNQLILFSHFIGFSNSNSIFFIYPAFHEYSPFFIGTEDNPFCQYPPKLLFPNASRFHLYYIFIVKTIYYKLGVKKLSQNVTCIRDISLKNLDDSIIVENSKVNSLDSRLHSLSQSGINFFEGWKFRDFESVINYSDKIREFFALVPEHSKAVDRFIQNIRTDKNTLIGLHIRLGDYKDQAPQWFYSLSYYESLINHLNKLFDGSNLKIIVASNEDLTKELTSNQNLCFCPNQIVQDLYILSQCDYIVGAPSTYSEWAAFYGKKPYYRILKEGLLPSISDFQYIDVVGRDF